MKLYFPSSFSGAMPWRISLLQFLFAFLSVSSHSNPRIILKNSSLVCWEERHKPMKFYSILLSGLYGRPPLDSTQRFVLLVKAQRRSSARPSVSGSSHGHEWYFLSCSTDLRIRTFHCLQTIVGHLQTNNGFDDRSKEKKENADNHPRRIVAEKRLTALDNPRTV